MRKKKPLLIFLAVVAVLCVAAVAALVGYNRIDHSRLMNKEKVIQYNNAITTMARGYNSIAAEEFILIDTVHKEQGGHTKVTFQVYRLPEGHAVSTYAHLRMRDVPADFAPEYMGSGTATLLNDSLDRILVTVAYAK